MDMLTLNNNPTSECRFDALVDKSAGIEAIRRASDALKIQLSLELSTLTASDARPQLTRDAQFKYDDQLPSFYQAMLDGEEVTIVIVRRSGKVIAFGIAEVPEDDAVSIELIDVAAGSRRSDGCSMSIQLESEAFEVGVAHILVVHMIHAINSECVHTDATNTHSRYVFKSVGFEPYSCDNPCLLHLKRDKHLH